MRRNAKGKPKVDAARFASIEFFHWLAIAVNRRRHERFQRIDNNGRHRMSATIIGSCPPQNPLMAAGLLDPYNELRPLRPPYDSRRARWDRPRDLPWSSNRTWPKLIPNWQNTRGQTLSLCRSMRARLAKSLTARVEPFSP